MRNHRDDGIPDEWDLGTVARDEQGFPLVEPILEALDEATTVVLEGQVITVERRFRLHGIPHPLAGLLLDLRITEASSPGAALVRAAPVTDDDGIVAPRLRIERAGTYQITASFPQMFPSLVVTSAPIRAFDRLPSGDGLRLGCESRVIMAFLDRDPAGAYTMVPGASTGCALTVADRTGAPIAGIDGVVFLRETGTVEPAQIDAAGRVTTRLTVDVDAPVDVATAGGRDGVPPGTAGFDPNDGLVRLVAVVQGAEAFVDTDGDGRYEAGVDGFDAAYDLPEPFVDADDDGEYDLDEAEGRVEVFHDADGDGVWTPSNGAWDDDTALWTSTTVLYTGALAVERSQHVLSCVDGCVPVEEAPAACGGAMAIRAGGRAELAITVADRNGNCVAGASASIAASAAFEVPVEPPAISAPCFDAQDRPGAPTATVVLPVGAVAVATAGEVATTVLYTDARGEARLYRFAAPVCLVP